MSLTHLPSKITGANKKEIAVLHEALSKLNFTISPEALESKKIDDSTTTALKSFQKKNKLKDSGKLNKDTIAVLNDELFDHFISTSKKRTARVQEMLEKVKIPAAQNETSIRSFGESTRKAIQKFQKKAKLPEDGKLNEATLTALQNASIKERLSTKTQIGKLQATLLWVAKVAKLNVVIDPAEIAGKVIGPTTIAAIKTIQQKYNLPVTGVVDQATLDKLQSVAVSKGIRVAPIKKPNALELSAITKVVRLNKVSPQVNNLQKALGFLGYQIDQTEFNKQEYGNTTSKAVLAFQQSKGLPQNGQLDTNGLKLLNAAIAGVNPEAAPSLKYRIRGSVIDSMWQRKSNMAIRVYEKLLNGEGTVPLATKLNHRNGFFDIIYQPPVDPVTNQPKTKFHLVVKLYQPQNSDPANDTFISSQIHYNVKRIHWVNFSQSVQVYEGDSDFAKKMTLLSQSLGATKLTDIQETQDNKQVTQLSIETALDVDDIMQLWLSASVSKNTNQPVLTPETFYAFIKQNLPPGLPGDLMRATNGWDAASIASLIETASTGIVFCSDTMQQQTLENAVTQNLVSQAIRINEATILQSLKTQRTSFTLSKPLLTANGTLQSLIGLSSIPAQQNTLVADTFISNQGFTDNFWTALNAQSSVLGADAIKDFSATVDLGMITKNHVPTIQYIKTNTGAGKQFVQLSDVAKLDQAGFVAMINSNGGSVPDNIPGNTPADKISTYAGILQSRAEKLFPAVAMVAAVKKNNASQFSSIAKVETFIDQNPGYNIKQNNLDQYIKTNNLSVDANTLTQLKVVQRINRVAPDSSTGSALISEKLHSSSQIYLTGKDRLATILQPHNINEQQSAIAYEKAKMQYLQVWYRYLQFNNSVTNGTPQAINKPIYSLTDADVQQVVSTVPDLEALFGSLDFCDCEECKSLYGPSAYFSDLLRFLKQHNSTKLQNGTPLTVKDILFERRADLGDIKLNCDNTNVALPYIDLACEILERPVAPVIDSTQLYQTTLTAPELRAMPQWMQRSAYDFLATADFPMSSSFNLWQEEARTYLQYLRVPRHELMEAFQDIKDNNNKKPADSTIAAEYFSISFHEHDIIVTKRDDTTNQNKYWGLDTTQVAVPVENFMSRAGLTYNQVLELLLVKFVNPAGDNQSVIDIPANSCDTTVQQITKLTVQRFDLMHRFLRAWRKTGWKMWELDLLLRNPAIGNNVLDENAIANLKRFRQLQIQLSITVETGLLFYDSINTENRVQPDKPDLTIPSLYSRLFQNISITNPVDPHFALPLDNTLVLGPNTISPNVIYNPVQTILSALVLRQPDFDLIADFTDNHLSLATVSTLLRHTYLARSLKLSISNFILLLKITNTTDPFSSVQTTLDFIKNYSLIKSSGFSLNELDYVLDYNVNSPTGLRNDTLVQLIDALRKILSTNKNNIDRLGLSVGDQNSILSFDADALVPLVNPALQTALQPLLDILNNALVSFKAAAFSVNETQFVLQFDTNSNSAAEKTNLVNDIKQIQKNLNALLNQNSNQIKSQVATSFGLIDEQAGFILSTIKLPGKTVALIDTLSDNHLLDTNPDGTFLDINTTNYPDHFNAYTLLHKISILLMRMPMETDDLEWYVVNFTMTNTLNFASLPIAPSPSIFSGWMNLYKFLRFKSRHPEPEGSSLRDTLALTASNDKTKIINAIAALTTWSVADLNSIDTGLELTVQDYTNAETWWRLQICFDQMNLTGVNADTMFKWSSIVNDPSPANLTAQSLSAYETRQAIKSKYESSEWLEKITPLYDTVREKKRDGLVAYLLENSQRNNPETVTSNGAQIPNILYWKDPNALFKYFLIDVEMCSCQLTSRIKQAISSVQFFVQRCFMNLEAPDVQVTQEDKEDTSSPNAWSQWKWMKSYVLWEANRKIFLYPENWLQPELRDDKSPFFVDFENEIMQGDITAENAEAAFLNYLHKVDEVSNLEIMGLYHEMEDLDGSVQGYEVNIVHVIGRTKAIPHVYYYRKYDMNAFTWSAWEKIDVEISGDQVLPVIYNRKLHLFWLTFLEKPIKAKKIPAAVQSPSSQPVDTPEPMKQLEIQLGWTIKKNNGWSTKKISKQKLIHPWERPLFSYNLKPYYHVSTNELYLDIYLSTSAEFNNEKFYDPFQANGSYMTRVTKNPYNETFLPWHSSAFVFNGEIKSVELKGLRGNYRLDPADLLATTTSYDFVHSDFGNDGRSIQRMQLVEFGPRLKLPNGMHFYNTKLTNNQHDAVNSSELRVLENATTATLLRATANPFDLVITQQDLQLDTAGTDHPVFYQDRVRSFFIKPEWQALIDSSGVQQFGLRKYHFYPFYHPYTTLFIRELNRSGVDGIFKRNIQAAPQNYPPADTFNFSSYAPTVSTIVDPTAQTDIVDFSYGGAYSIYNWELFFHAPFRIACLLTQNQKFEDALRWFNYIFNPSDIEALPTPQRYWITKPFAAYNSDDYRAQSIQNILTNIDLNGDTAGLLTQWRNHPFEPFVIARQRPVAFQKNVVMKYLDNLIAWGDQLFTQDTIESINQASLLYILAYDLLGPRPEKVPNVTHKDYSFNELETNGLDDFGNARVDVIIENNLLPVNIVPPTDDTPTLPNLETFYFCIPNNDYLFKYWDTVEDRLFKIRHCMNIEGVVQRLPLFDPPIDPALLVKAAAYGADLNSILNDLAAPVPLYRFKTIMMKALDFCSEVKSLGDKLLSVLEKKDAEALSLLHSQFDIQLLQAAMNIKKLQVNNAEQTIEGLNKSLEIAQKKYDYYASREKMNIAETTAFGLSIASTTLDAAIATGYILAGGLYAIPTFIAGAAGFGGSPTTTVGVGGKTFGDVADAAVKTLTATATAFDKGAALASMEATYERRQDDWDFQRDQASTEIQQIQFQINAAQISQQIAENDVDNQQLQIDNAKAIDDFMRSKYTNQELYTWMISQVATVYFQTYQLAYQMAKKAERSFQYELGIDDSSYIQFGYWDSLKKGLLSGDKLMYDLKRLDAAYLDQNKRSLEITKNISLLQMFPQSFIKVKESGQCTLSLPEWIFDMDYPGHYKRRIRNISITIPCVVGPYTGINCTVSLLKNKIRIVANGNYDDTTNADSFNVQYGEISSIATSHAQQDTGMFTLDFNDERFYPFEGAGVISDWQIDLPKDNNYFDFASLSDIILQINYTAEDGGATQAAKAKTNLQTVLPNIGARLFSLRHDFPTEWFKFFNPLVNTDEELVCTFKPEHFPFFLRNKINILNIKTMDLFVESDPANNFITSFKVTNTDYVNDVNIPPDPEFNNVPHLTKDVGTIPNGPAKALGEFRLKLKLNTATDYRSLTIDQVGDCYVLIQVGTN